MIHSIRISCLKNNLRRVRNFVEGVLKQHALSPVDINLMVLAVDELCANMIIHSHQCNPKEDIEVSVSKKDNQFVFEIKDESQPCFDLLSYKEPDMKEIIAEKRSGGIGLILVKKIMDEIQYERSGNANICRVSKRLSLDNPK